MDERTNMTMDVSGTTPVVETYRGRSVFERFVSRVICSHLRPLCGSHDYPEVEVHVTDAYFFALVRVSNYFDDVKNAVDVDEKRFRQVLAEVVGSVLSTDSQAVCSGIRRIDEDHWTSGFSIKIELCDYYQQLVEESTGRILRGKYTWEKDRRFEIDGCAVCFHDKHLEWCADASTERYEREMRFGRFVTIIGEWFELQNVFDIIDMKRNFSSITVSLDEHSKIEYCFLPKIGNCTPSNDYIPEFLWPTRNYEFVMTRSDMGKYMKIIDSLFEPVLSLGK